MLDSTFLNLTLLLLELLDLARCDLRHNCPQTLFLFIISLTYDIIVWVSGVGVLESSLAFLLVIYR